MRALVTGGASCGKSAFAEQLCVALGGNLVYLAAMRPFGEEGAARVRKHRAQRAGKGFTTIECYEGLASVLEDERLSGCTALLECLGNVAANELFGGEGHVRDVGEVAVTTTRELDELALRCAHLVVVGNEVGADGVGYPLETRTYQELVGSLSSDVAAHADMVVECVAGMPVFLKCEGAARAEEVARMVGQ